METKKIIEENKLIAKFMGWNDGMFSEPPEYDMMVLSKTEAVESVFYNYNEDELEYHISWDWLMPVVEKIVVPRGWQLKLIKYQKQLMKNLKYANIKQVWISEVEFIKQYNEYNKM